MAYRHNIRFRIFVTYPVLGLLLGLFMLVFLKISFQSLERQFLDSYLTEELNHFIKLAEKDPGLTLTRSKNWVIFKGDSNNPHPELMFLSGYPDGIHDVIQNQHGYDVAIKTQNQVRYTLIYDDTGFEELEHNLILYLGMAVFIILCLASWYGLWFSKKVIEPVASLASRIKLLDPEKASGYLSEEYTDDEVGILALEFDAYSRRLRALIQREREFTGNASHELRTPLAVIMAASEGLLAKQDISDEVALRIERIYRSAREMADRLDTLLTLARNPTSGNEAADKTDLVDIVEQLIDDHSNLLAEEVKVVKKIQGHPAIMAPSPIVSMLMGNLIKNAFLYTRQGSVTISLTEHEFTVKDTGQGIGEKDLGRIFDRGFRGASSRGSGLGLAISKRICEHYRWRLTIESKKQVGTLVRWRFG
jgi:signal transduction histidine kinase